MAEQEVPERIEEDTKKVSFWKKCGDFFKTIGCWIWANKKSICGTIFATISGVISAIALNSDFILSLPALVVFGANLTPIIVGILIFAGVEVGVIGKGFESIKTFNDRMKIKKAQDLEIKNKKTIARDEAKARKQAMALLKKKQKEEELLELAKKMENEQNK